MSFTQIGIQTASIATSLIAAGGIAALSLFDIPELQSQPASRSLPSIRWLFSRGSHIFPPASSLSAIGFAYLAYTALSPRRGVLQLLKFGENNSKTNAYLLAAALSFSIAPWTALVMVPRVNFKLIEKNEQYGGARSEKSAKETDITSTEGRSAEDSVDGKGDVNQFTDLSDPASRTQKGTGKEENAKVMEMLGQFGRLNAVRALLIGAGGIVGLVAALS